jgi:hypothetical protein
MAFTIGRAPPSSMAFAFEQPLEEEVPEVFHISAIPYPPAPADAFPLYLQWRAAGVDLGEPNVRVVDFIGTNIEATRGVGENYNVITVRLTIQSVFYTSHLYPVVADESLTSALSTPIGGLLWLPPVDSLNSDLSTPVSGTLATALQTYSAPAEKLGSDLSAPQSGTLVLVLKTYSAPAEMLNSDLSTPVTGTLVNVLIVYTNYVAEKLNSDLSTPVSGTLV